MEKIKGICPDLQPKLTLFIRRILHSFAVVMEIFRMKIACFQQKRKLKTFSDGLPHRFVCVFRRKFFVSITLILPFANRNIFIFAVSVGQDQTARMCSLILLYTLHYSVIHFCQQKSHQMPFNQLKCDCVILKTLNYAG